jgi:hypothetical protein
MHDPDLPMKLEFFGYRTGLVSGAAHLQRSLHLRYPIVGRWILWKLLPELKLAF